VGYGRCGDRPIVHYAALRGPAYVPARSRSSASRPSSPYAGSASPARRSPPCSATLWPRSRLCFAVTGSASDRPVSPSRRESRYRGDLGVDDVMTPGALTTSASPQGPRVTLRLSEPHLDSTRRFGERTVRRKRDSANGVTWAAARLEKPMCAFLGKYLALRLLARSGSALW
jgi:hypothetical protein